MTEFLKNIIIGAIGGLIVLIIQLIIDLFKAHKKNKKNLIVGTSNLKILDRNFLYEYEPGKVSIEKIIQDFGQPNRNQDDFENEKTLKKFFYIFRNAKVLITTYDKESEVISITLFSTKDIKNPVLCRLSYEDDDIIMGKAKLTESIVRDCINIEIKESIHEQTTIIKSKYFFKQLMSLTFCYSIDGNFGKLVDAKDQLIQQVCVTQDENITPMLCFFDTFYSE